MSRLFPRGDHRAGLVPLNETPYARDASDAWDDMQGTVQAAIQGASALTKDVYRDTPARIECFRHDQNDDVTFGLVGADVHFVVEKAGTSTPLPEAT